ncbi:Hypothetical predicted protein [Xyrichtys novacula]|uniref:Uncharacterized protein n=1 Tax=Xyrichtys novacula TaxID=13765 RepID=A0AAV1FEW4_XYRNO|nr:Hypothetical predicted protein [Xyrichtys novacula]
MCCSAVSTMARKPQVRTDRSLRQHHRRSAGKHLTAFNPSEEQPQNFRTSEPQNHRTSEPQNHRTTVPQYLLGPCSGSGLVSVFLFLEFLNHFCHTLTSLLHVSASSLLLPPPPRSSPPRSSPPSPSVFRRILSFGKVPACFLSINRNSWTRRLVPVRVSPSRGAAGPLRGLYGRENMKKTY